jgi:hypothetical protein
MGNYGRQLTCSPECESERRKRTRHHPRSPIGRDATIDSQARS